MNRTAALALAAAALLAGCTTSKECNLPTIKCGDRCLDPTTDAQNCGGCGVACAAGQVCCGSCMDPEALQTDTANCGACGHRCQPNATCTAGTCACTGAFPDDCGACVNLQTGAGGYCGVCGRVCQGTGVAGTDATCTAGACVCSGAATDCSATSPMIVCANTSTDEANCGACGVHCKPHAVCTGGACGCTDPAFPNDCTTPTSACVSFQTDAANCGSCGHACTGGTPTCSAGICCPTGWTSCSGTCVDTKTSGANCGTCGNACPGQLTCAGGTCGCGGSTPRQCGSLCCAGSACCAGGTACQTAHTNGLGGTFRDCTASYGTLTKDVALAAASVWQPAMAYQDYDLFCDGNCLARQTGTACAMWCYQGTYAGLAVSGGPACAALCTTFLGGGGSSWP